MLTGCRASSHYEEGRSEPNDPHRRTPNVSTIVCHPLVPTIWATGGDLRAWKPGVALYSHARPSSATVTVLTAISDSETCGRLRHGDGSLAASRTCSAGLVNCCFPQRTRCPVVRPPQSSSSLGNCLAVLHPYLMVDQQPASEAAVGLGKSERRSVERPPERCANQPTPARGGRGPCGLLHRAFGSSAFLLMGHHRTVREQVPGSVYL